MPAAWRPNLKRRARSLFAEIDADGDGTISRAELHTKVSADGELVAMMEMYDKELPDVATAAAIFDQLDADGDGRLTLEEFIQIIVPPAAEEDVTAENADTSEAQAEATEEEKPSLPPLPSVLRQLGPRPRCGTLFVVCEPFERLLEVLRGAQAALALDGEFVFATRLCSFGSELCSEFDRSVSLQTLDHHSDLNEASLSWTEEVEGDLVELMVLSESLDPYIAAGRSVVLHGHLSMVQTARLKYPRVCVLNSVDEAAEAMER
jgi:hypothetical protein